MKNVKNWCLKYTVEPFYMLGINVLAHLFLFSQ